LTAEEEARQQEFDRKADEAVGVAGEGCLFGCLPAAAVIVAILFNPLLLG
jgi:hypothetical protein